MPTEAAEALFRVIDAAYERRSVAISSNIHPRQVRTAAPGDDRHRCSRRFMHHAHLVVTEGDSYRSAPGPRPEGGDTIDLALTRGDLVSVSVEFYCLP
ncbi:MAG: ATP-binding protein, partial [Proteobacteria bacterium]|nr:ATP-binding protein [Pseudomonadota bacterium]